MTALLTVSFVRLSWAGPLLACLTLIAFPCSAAPNVVVTIKPIHSLAAAILEGVAEPKLLLDGAASPHAYALKPSDAEALSRADVLVRVSQNLEVFLNKAVSTLSGGARIIEVEQAPGLTLLSVRRGGLLESVAAEDDGDEDHHDHGSADVHFWLDPLNAIVIADYLTQQFAALDPDHEARYRANGQKLKAKLAALDSELKGVLAGLSDKPFIVFHDVTQYLEKRYGLHGLGAVTLSPERAPGAGRLAKIRDKIRGVKAICVFSEPQFPPKLIETLINATQARKGILDEIGAAVPAGPDQYFAFMRMNARSLAGCLKS
jgi:zinc transport system substrate-binding protein